MPKWVISFVIVCLAPGMISAPAQARTRIVGRPTASRAQTYGCPPATKVVHVNAPGRGKTVALTFDDGPGGSTSAIISLLARRHVPATFFNLGVSEHAHPRLVRMEGRDGFALGDHTWKHKDLATLGAAGQAREIDRERRLQARLTGHGSCLLRPPYGRYNQTTRLLAGRRHLVMWRWSVDTEDWKAAGSSAPHWVRRIAARAEAGGAQKHPLVLLHDESIGNPATVAALPRIIRFYRQHGYTFVDLTGNTEAPGGRANPVARSAPRHAQVTGDQGADSAYRRRRVGQD